MVKGFDTTLSDPSKMLLDHLFSFFDSSRTSITPEQASTYIKQWLKSNTSTSKLYKKFNQQEKRPKIILKKQCSKPWIQKCPYEGDNNFGAYQKQQQIYVCLNNIRNKIELKENIDRELNIMYNMHINDKKEKEKEKENVKEIDQKQKDRMLILNLYESCREGYRNYGWVDETNKRVSKKCAIYLFRRRSTSNLPPDSLFRYASKIADQYCL